MTRATIAVLIAAGLTSPTFGQFTDGFTSSSANWGAAAVSNAGGHNPGTTSMSFGIGSGRVNFTGNVSPNTVPPASETNQVIPLQSYAGSYDSSWSVQIDVTNSFSTSITGQSLQLGLLVSNTDGMSSPFTHDYLKLVLLRSAATNNTFVHGGIHLNGNSGIDYVPLNLSGVATTGPLTISYNGSTHVFTTSYNSSTHSSFGVAGSGGTGNNQNWNMTTGGTFTISLFAQVVNNYVPAGFAITDGTGYIDNFSSTGLSAVPEPSTYAAIAGLAVLGLAAWRRRKSA